MYWCSVQQRLEIPVDYKLIGNYKYLEKMVSRIKGRESTSGLNISEVKKCTWLMFQMAELQGTQGPKKTNNYRLHFTKSPKLYFLVKNADENVP